MMLFFLIQFELATVLVLFIAIVVFTLTIFFKAITPKVVIIIMHLTIVFVSQVFVFVLGFLFFVAFHFVSSFRWLFMLRE